MNHDDPFEDGDPIGGWLLGHELAHGRHGFPGDPLPDGHLGRPADLAFWGSVGEGFEDDADPAAPDAVDDWDDPDLW